MNEKVLQKWIDALRTTDKAQGRGFLKYKNENSSYSYCCLGILCEDVLKLETDPEPESTSDEYIDRQECYFDGQSGLIPIVFTERIGINSWSNTEPGERGADISITIDKESYNQGMEESKDFAFGVQKIRKKSGEDPFNDLPESFLVTSLNDDYGLTFREIAAFLQYAYSVE